MIRKESSFYFRGHRLATFKRDRENPDIEFHHDALQYPVWSLDDLTTFCSWMMRCIVACRATHISHDPNLPEDVSLN